MIEKIRLKNFHKFKELELKFDKRINIFVGDNESGKSTILSAIDLTLSGSIYKVENIGLRNIFNIDVISDFMNNESKSYESLPKVFIEICLSKDNENYELNGKNNSYEESTNGLKLEIIPNDEFSEEISNIIKEEEFAFPFEYYKISFNTFSGKLYSQYKKHLNHIFIDNSKINERTSNYKYIENMYNSRIDSVNKYKYQNKFQKAKQTFVNNVLNDLNKEIADYKFSIKSNIKDDLEKQLTLLENGVDIINKGTGKQCVIKTKFALLKSKEKKHENKIVLIEEPENHLSHINMNKLIDIIKEYDKQIFISTHSNLITSRLGLNNVIMMSDNNQITLNDINSDTNEYFVKAPNQNILNFILSKKVILVEGNVEFLLTEKFYEIVNSSSMNADGIFVISTGGLSFKRYLEIAKKLSIKIAVIRDNDKSYQENCVDNYKDYTNDSIKIFSDRKKERHTFEVCFYQDNKDFCDNKFKTLDDMLKKNNKTSNAFKILKTEEEITVPLYIKEAMKWIKK